MKLKKLMALALSGVLAVSMFAGCAKADVKPEPTPNPDPTPSTSSYAEMLVDGMTKQSQNLVTPVADADLDAALADAVDVYFNDLQAAISGSNFWVDMNSNGNRGFDVRYTDLGRAVARAMGHANDEIGDLDDTLTGEGKTNIAVETYAFNGSMSDEVILEKLGMKVDQSIRNLPTSSELSFDDLYTEFVYDYDYEVSASIETVTGKYMGVDVSVKYVSIAVVQTATEA